MTHFVGIDPTVQVSAASFVSVARSFVGVPFLHQGRTRNGIDCVGLVIAALTKVGIVHYEEPPTYPRLPFGDSLLEPLRQYCTETDTLEPGIVLAIRFRRLVTHVAVLSGPTIIHAYEGARRAVEHGYDKRWAALTVARYRLPGVIYNV
jgi:cell wall-associated NlpC family hydrolase